MTPWVVRLIAANVLMYFLELTLPRVASYLVFVPAFAIRHPWTIITYMFLHDPNGFTHILFNMLGLYFFGPRVEERLGSSRFLVLYLISGIAGALLSAIFAWRSPILGASGALFGVMLAFATFWPTERILIWGVLPVEARILVLFYTALSLYSGLRGSQGGVADFAHLGGFVGAFFYLQWFQRSAGAKKFKQRVVEKVEDPTLLKWKKIDVQKAHEVNREELNRILDKINRHGLNSLSVQERLFLSNFIPKDDQRPPPS